MSKQASDQAAKYKSLVEDLEQRIEDLKHSDAASEVNSHCDDLIGQVMLTIESAMDHLNKVQTRMVNEVNEYRTNLLDAAVSSKEKLSPAQEELKKLSQEFQGFKSNSQDFGMSTMSLADALKEKACDLRKRMRAEA